MEAKYLKENLGCLAACLREVVVHRPHDPIEYIAFWLKKHIENEQYRAKVRTFSIYDIPKYFSCYFIMF